MTAPGRCRSCGAPILWATTASGRKMPVDAEPVADGTLVLRERDGEVFVVVAANAESNVVGPRHRAHFATCPDAESWRQRR